MITSVHLVYAIILTNYALAQPVDDKTNVDYTKCVSDSHALFIKGIENIVETSDPLSVKFVNGTVPGLKHEVYDSTLTGLSDCKVTKLSVNRKESNFDYNLECPHLMARANYIIMGKLADYYVEGNGINSVTTGIYILKFHGHFDRIIGEDNIEHAHVKSHSSDFEPKDTVKLYFENLYGGDKEKSDEFHNFVSENWELVEEKLRATILSGFMDTFIQNLNDFLKVVPIQQIFPPSC